MPERSAFDESMRLSRARLRVQDDDLKFGEVEMLVNNTTIGPIPAPWGIQGGFAVVYKFRTHSNKLRALRCFIVQVETDMQFRYEHIGTYFATHVPEITAEFKYHHAGISVKENVQGQFLHKVYPLIEMEWVEGMTLLEYVDKLCKQRDVAKLTDLADQWLALLKTLQQARIAHGDLAGTNVMVRSNGRLVLVDYDGVYIPDFAGRPSVVIGQVDYQHPQMNQRPFNEQADNFSALVIYTALLALQAQPDLWDSYVTRAQGLQDTGLLFKQRDFVDPDHSLLMSELENIGNPQVNMAVQALKQACLQPIAQVRFPSRFLDPYFEQKQALIKLEQAIQHGNDEEIINIWASASLDSYTPAQQSYPRVEQARQTLKALKRLHDAFQTHSIQRIVAAYDARLDFCKSVKKEERDLLHAAENFLAAYNNDDDDALASACDEIRISNYGSFFTFTSQEIQRAKLAQQRRDALLKFRRALVSREVQHIVTAYDAVLDGCKNVTIDDQHILQATREFVAAYNRDDDEDIISASHATQNLPTNIIFTQQEQQRIALAHNRKAALAAFHLALSSKSIQQIVTAYDIVLDNSKSVTSEKRDLLRVARDFLQACQNEDDQAIVSASEVIQRKNHYSQYLIFTVQEEQRVMLAQQRTAALLRLRNALANKNMEQIIAAYDTLLIGCKNVTLEEREQVSLAHDLVQAYHSDNDQTILTAWKDIQSSRHQQAFVLTVQQEQRITLAARRMNALKQLRNVLRTGSRAAEQVVLAYDSVLDDCQQVAPDERALVQSASRFLKMQASLLDAIKADNDEQIVAIYDKGLAQQFYGFTQEHSARTNKALKYGKLMQALQSDDYGYAIRLAQEIEIESHKPMTDFQLIQAKQRFIKYFDIKDLEAWLQGYEVIARWNWPADDLIRYAVIVWRVDRWPRNPRREEAGTEQTWVFRSRNEQKSTTRFRVAQQTPVYLQVYLAIPNDAQQPVTWFYSTGKEPSSKKVAYSQGAHIQTNGYRSFNDQKLF